MNTCTSTAQPEREPSKFEVAAPIVRLWLLRILVPLGGHKKFIAYIVRVAKHFEKMENSRTQLLRLKHQIEQKVNDEFEPVLKKLSKTYIEATKIYLFKKLSKDYREATKICKSAKKELAEDWIIQALELEHWTEQVENNEFDKKSALKELSKLYEAAEKELKNAKFPDFITIKHFAKPKLSETDCRILEFDVLCHCEPSFARAFNIVDPPNDLLWNHLHHQDDDVALSAVLSVLLALPQDEICLSIGDNGTLAKLGKLGPVKRFTLRLLWHWHCFLVRKAC